MGQYKTIEEQLSKSKKVIKRRKPLQLKSCETIPEKKHRVLVISDTQAPFHHKDTVPFLMDVYKTYNCNTVVHIGDEVDLSYLSFYAKDPDGLSANQEYHLATKFMKQLYEVFPNVQSCISNHTSRPYRKAFDAGIPEGFLKPYKEFLQAPDGWSWKDRIIIDDVVYQHGIGYSGENGHKKAAKENRQSTVIGHLHSHMGIHYFSNHSDRIFGMNVGCLIDVHSIAFKYGKFHGNKPTLGCGVVIDGEYGIPVPMNLGSRVKRHYD